MLDFVTETVAAREACAAEAAAGADGGTPPAPVPPADPQDPAATPGFACVAPDPAAATTGTP
jgi:hypothetical protein